MDIVEESLMTDSVECLTKIYSDYVGKVSGLGSVQAGRDVV